MLHRVRPTVSVSVSASVCAVVLATAWLLGAAGSASAASVVTGIVGEVKGGERPLAIHDPIVPGADVELGVAGRCAVLLSSNAMLQLCDEALARFRSSDRGDRAIVELDRGSLKATVESGGEASQVEIHTPAAIATVLGTIVHVEVDPETGDTTVSSLESRVRVAAAPAPGDPPGAVDPFGGVVIGPGQQVVVPAGGRPGPVHEFDPSVLRSSQRCLDDEPFRTSAVRAARKIDQLLKVDEIARSDVPTAIDRIDVASGPAAGGGSRILDLGRPEVTRVDLCFLEPTSCARAPLSLPPVCGAVPGDHCQIR